MVLLTAQSLLVFLVGQHAESLQDPEPVDFDNFGYNSLLPHVVGTVGVVDGGIVDESEHQYVDHGEPAHHLMLGQHRLHEDGKRMDQDLHALGGADRIREVYEEPQHVLHLLVGLRLHPHQQHFVEGRWRFQQL